MCLHLELVIFSRHSFPELLRKLLPFRALFPMSFEKVVTRSRSWFISSKFAAKSFRSSTKKRCVILKFRSFVGPTQYPFLCWRRCDSGLSASMNKSTDKLSPWNTPVLYLIMSDSIVLSEPTMDSLVAQFLVSASIARIN